MVIWQKWPVDLIVCKKEQKFSKGSSPLFLLIYVNRAVQLVL